MSAVPNAFIESTLAANVIAAKRLRDLLRKAAWTLDSKETARHLTAALVLADRVVEGGDQLLGAIGASEEP